MLPVNHKLYDSLIRNISGTTYFCMLKEKGAGGGMGGEEDIDISILDGRGRTYPNKYALK